MRSTFKPMGLLLGLLFAGTMIVQGQNGNIQPAFRNRAFNRIPDLTETQKTEITALGQKHQVKMDTLRAEMTRTTDIGKRGDIARELQIERDTHRQNVLNLLTDKQKEAFLAAGPTARGGRGPAYGQAGRNSRGMGPGNRNYDMRGRGRGMGPGNMNCNCRPMMQGQGRGTRQ